MQPTETATSDLSKTRHPPKDPNDTRTKEQRYWDNHRHEAAFKERRKKIAKRSYAKGGGERRREKRHRFAQRRKKEGRQLRTMGLFIVTGQQMQADDTQWRGPGAGKERRLEKQADAILKANRNRAAAPTPIRPTTSEISVPEPRTFQEIVVDLYLQKLRR
jgi:hypothetical protein